MLVFKMVGKSFEFKQSLFVGWKFNKSVCQKVEETSLKLQLMEKN